MRSPAIDPPHAAPPRPTGRALRITGLTGRAFSDHTQPLVGWKASEQALDVMRQWLPDLGTDVLRAARGTSMITMSRDLLVDAGTDPDVDPDVDTVLLAYSTPDLYDADVAGCWLSDRLPGSPVPASVDQPGPGAVFTALRIAEGLARLGDLRTGMVLGFDQNAVARLRDAGHPGTDSAVLLLVGTGDRGLAVGHLGDDLVDDPADLARSAAGTLTRIAGDNPPAEVVLGPGLHGAAEAVATALGRRPRLAGAPASACTGVWTALSRLAPLTGPALLADYDPIARRLYRCLVDPEVRR